MELHWLNDEEAEIRVEGRRRPSGGDVILALRFDPGYSRWETQSWPNEPFTPDDVWYEVDLEDGPVRAELQLARERAAIVPEGAARDAAVFAYQQRLAIYREEIKDLAIQAAIRRAKAALRND